MPDYYLICKKCNGYYKLEEDEYEKGTPNWKFGDPENLILSNLNSCSVCGGDLILVDDIDEYCQHPDEEYVTKKGKRNHLSKIVFILAILCVITSLILIPNSIFSNLLVLHNSITPDHSFLGSDSVGYVTKDVYAHYSTSAPKIAIITGMHP